MWVVVHMVSGVAIGSAVPGSVWLALAAALLGHVLLDLVPHWDYTRTRLALTWGFLDVLAAVAFGLVCWTVFHLPAKALLAGAVSAAPDLDVLNALVPYDRRTRFFPSHWDRFPHGHATPLPGVLTQAVVVAVSLAVIVATR